MLLDDLIPGRAEIIEGELVQVRPFNLMESLRLAREPKVQALVASLAKRQDRLLELDRLLSLGADEDQAAAAAIEEFCLALEGHDEVLQALTCTAAEMPAKRFARLNGASQALLALAMIAENQDFFGRRLENALIQQGWRPASLSYQAAASSRQP